MKIELRKVSQHGNNLVAQMFFNGIIVARDIQCTPKEFYEFTGLLHAGNEASGGKSEDIVYDKH